MRLIDADKLHDYFYYMPEDYFKTYAIAEVVKEQSTIDAVPVIRCKDCIKRTKLEKTNSMICSKFFVTVTDSFYCGFGEREKNE